MKSIEWTGCLRQVRAGDTVVNVWGLVDGEGTVTCPGCVMATMKVRVKDVTQVEMKGLRRKVNQATIVEVGEVVGGCAKRVFDC